MRVQTESKHAAIMSLVKGMASLTLGAALMATPHLLNLGKVGHVVTVMTLPPGKIAFSSPVEGLSQEIVKVSPAGGVKQALSQHPGVDVDPAWSPDGSRLAFSSFRDGTWGVYVMDGDGANLHLVVKYALAPSWSPDGTQLAISCSEHSSGGAASSICLVSTDGKAHKKLDSSGEPQSSQSHPAWSPDGKIIAYDSDEAGNYDIWTIGSDGKGLRRLTHSRANETCPAWSPDGRLIAFTSDRYAVRKNPTSHRNTDILVMKSNGTGIRRVTLTPAAESFPEWSPDGKWILHGYSEEGCASLRVISLDGKTIVPVSKPDSWDYAPASWCR